mmetsp:Transcript_5120/g.5925  ORF Transcript_5120/g.5925 Transcript_5120/m.5925 type:complete len:381 (+) Transcript_5120:256-1398(+)|eukprot:CAMPEP_0184017414 /NCGR_PEP_ID=MMETSP0954-20121128/7522_1 /TAXON_ID=627963 /ORGANISM="Aplanochytrium sp, Strain PBS07" /LENGTH=380 /DNA_ID=CAMNT_0026298645 /DNA_START=176 /DNA_END=1318 /DNA_ORIENTATION=-
MGNKSTSLTTSEWVQRLPKVELHVHLDGAFDDELLFNEWISNQDALDVPDDIAAKLSNCGSLEAFRKITTTTGERSLQSMFDCFDTFLPLVVGNLNLIERLAYKFFLTQVEQNVVYTEVRYSPQLLDKGDNPIEVVRAVTKGLRKGHREHPNFYVNQILCCMDRNPSWSIPVVEIANSLRNDFPCAVVGVDIAAGENYLSTLQHGGTEDVQLHKQAMDMATDMGLNITIHAGEVGGTENILYAVNSLGAKRIGHGYAITDENSAENLAKLVEKGTHFEVCPTSSFETGGWRGEAAESKMWNTHPLKTMIANGASVSINTDDPAVFSTSALNDYEIVLNDIGLSRKEIVGLMYDSIQASFCPAEQKKPLRKMLQMFERKWK